MDSSYKSAWYEVCCGEKYRVGKLKTKTNQTRPIMLNLLNWMSSMGPVCGPDADCVGAQGQCTDTT